MQTTSSFAQFMLVGSLQYEPLKRHVHKIGLITTNHVATTAPMTSVTTLLRVSRYTNFSADFHYWHVPDIVQHEPSSVKMRKIPQDAIVDRIRQPMSSQVVSIDCEFYISL